jgi:hypothetical protein
MKRFLKTSLVVLCVLFVLWAITFSADYQRASRLREPVFAVSDGSPSANTAVTCTGLGYTVECRYNSHGTLCETSLYLLDTYLTGCVFAIPL